jgi:hypothetical protein
MIIDIHRHLVAKEWYSENFWDGHARMVQRMATDMGIPLSIEYIQTHMFAAYFDTTGEKHLEQMEKAGLIRQLFFYLIPACLQESRQFPYRSKIRSFLMLRRNTLISLSPLRRLIRGGRGL